MSKLNIPPFLPPGALLRRPAYIPRLIVHCSRVCWYILRVLYWLERVGRDSLFPLPLRRDVWYRSWIEELAPTTWPRRFMLPLVTRVYPNLIVADLLAVQPLAVPVDSSFYHLLIGKEVADDDDAPR